MTEHPGEFLEIQQFSSNSPEREFFSKQTEIAQKNCCKQQTNSHPATLCLLNYIMCCMIDLCARLIEPTMSCQTASTTATAATSAAQTEKPPPPPIQVRNLRDTRSPAAQTRKPPPPPIQEARTLRDAELRRARAKLKLQHDDEKATQRLIKLGTRSLAMKTRGRNVYACRRIGRNVYACRRARRNDGEVIINNGAQPLAPCRKSRPMVRVDEVVPTLPPLPPLPLCGSTRRTASGFHGGNAFSSIYGSRDYPLDLTTP